jgi:hypothetical protein
MQAMSVSTAKLIDERALFRDLLVELRRRRYTPETQKVIDKIIYKNPEHGVDPDEVESTRASTPLFSEAGEEEAGLEAFRSD